MTFGPFLPAVAARSHVVSIPKRNQVERGASERVCACASSPGATIHDSSASRAPVSSSSCRRTSLPQFLARRATEITQPSARERQPSGPRADPRSTPSRPRLNPGSNPGRPQVSTPRRHRAPTRIDPGPAWDPSSIDTDRPRADPASIPDRHMPDPGSALGFRPCDSRRRAEIAHSPGSASRCFGRADTSSGRCRRGLHSGHSLSAAWADTRAGTRGAESRRRPRARSRTHRAQNWKDLEKIGTIVD